MPQDASVAGKKRFSGIKVVRALPSIEQALNVPAVSNRVKTIYVI
jgi:hypothetical protein